MVSSCSSFAFPLAFGAVAPDATRTRELRGARMKDSSAMKDGSMGAINQLLDQCNIPESPMLTETHLHVGHVACVHQTHLLRLQNLLDFA